MSNTQPNEFPTGKNYEFHDPFMDRTELPEAEAYCRNQVIEKLEEFAAKFETQAEAAQELGVSRVFLWRVLNHKKPPSQKVLEKIGFVKEVRQAEYYYKADEVSYGSDHAND